MKLLIVANWKCNPTRLKEADDILHLTWKEMTSIKNVEVVFCPPFLYLSNLVKNYSKIIFGAQDVFWENAGAYTGEISPLQLKNLGVKYVIIGHSERRKYQKETDEIIAKKNKASLSAGLRPILCIDKISQIEKGLSLVENWKSESENLIIAFEPLSAIGTGKPYDVKKSAKIYTNIKKIVGENIPVLYGGSVDSKNAVAYIKEAGFEGLLIGGASLKPKEFTEIMKIFQ